MSAMKALAVLSTLHGADIVLPTTGAREIRLRRRTEPTVVYCRPPLVTNFG
jgi:hypothetical protein